MDADFPAAHSMDTTWFAVDRDGHVACFKSGESGAVPSGAFAGEDAHALGRRLGQLLPRCPAAFDLAGRQMPGGEGSGNPHEAHGLGLDYPVLLFLQSPDVVKEALASGQAVQVPSDRGTAVTFQHLPAELDRRLHEADACLGCFFLFGRIDAEGFEPASHGLYEYSHLTENWISGPYGRVARPLQPLHVDQLPPDLRGLVRGMRFENLSFAETAHVQPLEHTECVSWEAAYLDVTGTKVRPVPGREDDYADAVGELDDLAGEGIEVEPPPGAEGGEGAEP
jgi:hypothetical protein